MPRTICPDKSVEIMRNGNLHKMASCSWMINNGEMVKLLNGPIFNFHLKDDTKKNSYNTLMKERRNDIIFVDMHTKTKMHHNVVIVSNSMEYT